MIENNEPQEQPERLEFRGQGENFYDPGAAFGPIELNILERVEHGLNLSYDNENDDKNFETPLNEREMYEGPKEVIFVTGWVNIDSVYQRYKYGFISKILLGLAVIGCLLYYSQNFAPVALLLCAINLAHIVKNLAYLYLYRGSNTRIKMIFMIELHISLGYFIYFFGFFLLLTHRISTKFFLLYSLPYIALTLFIFFYNGEENNYLSQKKFSAFEAFQMLLIAVKFAQIGSVDWNYTLLFFMTAAIYVTVIGLLLMIILSCSLFGFLYRDLEQWKVKSLVWMTFYYLSTGLVYIYIIKGVIQFYGEENPYDIPIIPDYTNYKSRTFDVLLASAILMVLFSAASLAMHLLWKNDIKKYLAKVIYKNELRKEVSLRFLTKSFTFRLIQVSTTYFMKPDAQATKADPEGDAPLPITNDNPNASPDVPEVKEGPEKEAASVKNAKGEKVGSSKSDSDLCVFCYTDKPNIMIDTCGHGGVCKTCMLCYLKNDGAKCPFCKGPISKLYVLSYDEKEKQYYAKGEIKFRT